MPARVAFALVAAATLIGWPAASRTQAQDRPPAFEVATVKISGPESAAMSIQLLPGGRLVMSSIPLPDAIQWAYELEDGRLAGVPRGLDSVRVDVVAKTPDSEPRRGQVQAMMRTLLAERFKLAVHHETRELITYTLVTDPGGPKVRASNNGAPGPNPFRMSDSGTLIGTTVTAAMLARVLSNQLGRPVQDQTGFSGVFDFTLRWAPDTNTEPTDRPSLPTALREQLGFRLEPHRQPTDVVVIDRVERTPAGN
jgi:uncharacterized protein (TIGR03435 family)